MPKLVIIGAGGFGREVLDVVEACQAAGADIDFIGFLDDEADPALVTSRGAAIIGPVADLANLDAQYVIGIGSSAARHTIDELASRAGREATTLVHPAATIGAAVTLGPGAVVTAGARLTTNIVAGRHLHVNLNATIGHDCVLGDYVTINPGANVSGNVTLGDGVALGTGSSVIQRVSIGAGTIVGAGAAVVSDLPAGVTAVGVPAKPLAR